MQGGKKRALFRVGVCMGVLRDRLAPQAWRVDAWSRGWMALYFEAFWQKCLSLLLLLSCLNLLRMFLESISFRNAREDRC